MADADLAYKVYLTFADRPLAYFDNGFNLLQANDVLAITSSLPQNPGACNRTSESKVIKEIRKLHQILMTGTVDEYREQVRPGEYRTPTSRARDRQLLPAGQIHSSLGELIAGYEHQTEIERNHILDFHVRFEEIFPFEDGNGRIGRLILFKECLRHDIMPFIIDDKRRPRYLRGIKEWQVDRYELVDVVMEAQDRFEAQIELQKLCAHTRLYLPTDYKEDGAMDMKKLCPDADTVLELLYNTYYEHVCTDEIKQTFDDLYNALSDKTLKEKDAIIDLVCNLCRLHQQSGFIAALKLSHRLSQELKCLIQRKGPPGHPGRPCTLNNV